MRLSTLSLCCALCCGAAQAQNYELHLIFESPPGFRPPQALRAGFEAASGSAAVDDPFFFDIIPTGLLLTRENEDGFLTGLLVVDPRTREVTWRMTAEDLDALGFTGGVFNAARGAGQEGGGLWNETGGLLGLVNLYGDGTRYPVFSGEGRLLVVDPRTNATAFSLDFDDGAGIAVRFADVTGDGTHELLVYLPGTKVLQVWGAVDVVGTAPRP